MEYYLTTYNKDFKWPVPYSSQKSDLLAKHKAEAYQEAARPEPCSKYLSKNDKSPEEQLVAPAQTGAPPAGPETKHNQPFTYLRKLYMKYPYLYNILKLHQPEQLAPEVYSIKYLSTYRADYKSEGFEPLKGWLTQELPKEDDESKQDPIGQTVASPGEPQLQAPRIDNQPAEGDHKDLDKEKEEEEGDKASPYLNAVRSIASKPATISKMTRPPNTKKKQDDKPPPEYTGGQHPPKLGKWKSEYRDTISRIGGIIIRKKMLSKANEE